MLICFGNLNFGRAADHGNDVRRMAEKGADVICLVELRRVMIAEDYETFQPDRRDGDVGSEAILVKRDLPVRARSKINASLSLFGERIGWRRILGVTIGATDGVPKFQVLVVHMPPLRMRGPLYAAYALRLRARLRRLNRKGVPWIVFGDWNWLLGNDPAGLRQLFKARWVGKRIDGAAIHPALVPFLRDWHTWQPPGRRDNHPYVYVRLGK